MSREAGARAIRHAVISNALRGYVGDRIRDDVSDKVVDALQAATPAPSRQRGVARAGAEGDDVSDEALRYAAGLHAMTCNDNPGHQDWHDCATTGPCAGEGRRLASVLALLPAPHRDDDAVSPHISTERVSPETAAAIQRIADTPVTVADLRVRYDDDSAPDVPDAEAREAAARAYRWVADDIEVGGIDFAHYPALLRGKADALLAAAPAPTEAGDE